jgi:RecA-family ATPase
MAFQPRVPGSDDGGPSAPFDPVPLDEFLEIEFPPMAWLVPGIVPHRQTTLIVSAPNAGKTLLAFDYAALSAQQGRRVLVVEEEGSGRGCQERLHRAADAYNLTKQQMRKIEVVYNSHFSLLEPGAVALLSEWVKFQSIEVIIFDSIAAITRGSDENDSATMSLISEALHRVCADTQSAVIGLHHMTKEAWKPGQIPTLGSARGHGALVARVDTVLGIVPLESPGGTVRFELYCLKMREAERAQPRTMEVLMTGPAAIVRSIEMDATARQSNIQRRASERLAATMKEVVLAVPLGEENAVTSNQVVDKLGTHKQTILAAIKELLFAEKLRQLGNGKVYRMKASASGDGRFTSDSGRYHRYSSVRTDPNGEGDD